MQPDPRQGLARFIPLQVELPDDELQWLAQGCRSLRVAKGEHLFHAGELAADFYFVLHGVVRLYYSTDQGKEFNKSFLGAGDVAGCLISLSRAQPCRFSLQALSEGQVLCLSGDLLQKAYKRHPAWERLGRIFMESLALKKEMREASLLLDDAQQRYQSFLRDYSVLAEQIPLYHIASYLGITDVALSRIRARLKSSIS